jgi:hypothetical protein
VGKVVDGVITNSHTACLVSGGYGTAGLVGYLESSTCSNCYSNSNILGTTQIGGLIGGTQLSSILNCHASGNVEGGITEVDSGIGGLLGTATHCTISNSSATGTVSMESEGRVGGLVGVSSGNSLITDCYATGDVSVSSISFSSGSLVSWVSSGGLVGDNSSSTINHSYSTGDVSGHDRVGGLIGSMYQGAVSNTYALGNVTGDGAWIGGLVGRNSDAPGCTITNSYARGNVLGVGTASLIGGLVGEGTGTVTNCYAIGSVAGHMYVGALFGDGRAMTFSDIFWDTETSNRSNMCGLGDNCDDMNGKTTAEMKQITTFTNWDFIETWGIEDNQTYPFLKLTYPIGDLNYDHIVNFLDVAIQANHWLDETNL